MKRIISQHAFEQEASAAFQAEYTKGLVVPAGRDSLHQIGHPPGLDGVTDRDRLNDAWTRTFQASRARRRPRGARDQMKHPPHVTCTQARAPSFASSRRPPPRVQGIFPPGADAARVDARDKKKHVVDSDAYAEEAVDVLRIQKLKELTQRAARFKAEAAAEASAAAARASAGAAAAGGGAGGAR